MLISIIIPVYNRAEKVKRTLHSALLQSYRPLQLILVDNHSQDCTLEVLQEFKRQHEQTDLEIKVATETRHSACAARNKGLETATGEWIMFFDSDDEMLPELVENYAEKIGKHGGNIDVIATRCRKVLQNGSSKTLPFFHDDIMANELLHSILATQRYIVRRAFLDQVGTWNEELTRWNDLEMGVRLLLNNPRMDFIDKTLVNIYESGQDSLSGNDFSSHQGQWEKALDVIQAHLEMANIHALQRYLNLIDYRRVALAAFYARETHSTLGRELYSQAYARLSATSMWGKWLIPILYRRIVAGKRGSSRIAGILLR